MYDNIGGKIKGLAKALFIIEAIAAAIGGIAMIRIDEDLILAGLLVIVVGFFVSWVSSWFLYGFGELIDKTCAIEQNTRGVGRRFDTQAKFDDERKIETQINADNDRISNLERLRAQGLITEEEYQQAISKK